MKGFGSTEACTDKVLDKRVEHTRLNLEGPIRGKCMGERQ